MNKGGKLSRRDFLRLSAVAAAGTMVAACGGPAATPGRPRSSNVKRSCVEQEVQEPQSDKAITTA